LSFIDPVSGAQRDFVSALELEAVADSR
jgi:hypothetical protein